MLFTSLVVEEGAVLRQVGNERRIDPTGRRGGGPCKLQQVQGDSRIAVRVARDSHQRLFLRCESQRPKPAFLILECPAEDAHHHLGAERLQHVHFRARQQRGVHLERGVLRRCADEHDIAPFDAREKGVLLGLVEPVNLVYEQDRATSQPSASLLGFRHHRADFLDAGEDRAE